MSPGPPAGTVGWLPVTTRNDHERTASAIRSLFSHCFGGQSPKWRRLQGHAPSGPWKAEQSLLAEGPRKFHGPLVSVQSRGWLQGWGEAKGAEPKVGSGTNGPGERVSFPPLPINAVYKTAINYSSWKEKGGIQQWFLPTLPAISSVLSTAKRGGLHRRRNSPCPVFKDRPGQRLHVEGERP